MSHGGPRVVGEVVILDWACSGSCPGDANADGVVNVSDLVEVVLAWGACPAA